MGQTKMAAGAILDMMFHHQTIKTSKQAHCISLEVCVVGHVPTTSTSSCADVVFLHYHTTCVKMCTSHVQICQDKPSQDSTLHQPRGLCCGLCPINLDIIMCRCFVFALPNHLCEQKVHKPCPNLPRQAKPRDYTASASRFVLWVMSQQPRHHHVQMLCFCTTKPLVCENVHKPCPNLPRQAKPSHYTPSASRFVMWIESQQP